MKRACKMYELTNMTAIPTIKCIIICEDEPFSITVNVISAN